MKNLTNQAISVLLCRASLIKEANGKVTHAEMVAEAQKLVDMGVRKEHVDLALFKVENLNNVSA